ncbi:MAG: FliH/SctL family protein [Syntrophomonadaceae bacterium]|nr:FliH/SctL family protein [Syntrophomonadaceae bacterium]
MSRIIKAGDLVIKNSRRLAGLVEGVAEIPLPGVVEYAPRGQVEEARAEAAAILQETEAMVRELLEQARRDAACLLEDARDEARRLREEAEAEVERVRAEAREAGYRQGLQAVHKELEERRKRALAECERLVHEARLQHEAIVRAAEKDIIRLAVAVAAKLVEREIEQDPAIVAGLVQSALSLLGDSGSVRLLVNPRDYERLVQEQGSLVRPGQGVDLVSIQAHASISPGGFLLESDVGSVDAQLETRLRNLEEALCEAATDAE